MSEEKHDTWQSNQIMVDLIATHVGNLLDKIDLDTFIKINDKYGHLWTDSPEWYHQMAVVLRDTVKPLIKARKAKLKGTST